MDENKVKDLESLIETYEQSIKNLTNKNKRLEEENKFYKDKIDKLSEFILNTDLSTLDKWEIKKILESQV